MTADELKVILAMFKALTATPGTEHIDSRERAIREAQSLIDAKEIALTHKRLIRDLESSGHGY